MADKYLEAGAMGTTAAGAAGATYLATADERKRNKQDKARQDKRKKESEARKAKTNAGKVQVAEQKIQELERIKSKDLSAKDRKIKAELIKRERDIVKGLKPKTLAQTAAKLGLKSIPGIGAFLTAFSSTPAGKGSDRGLPNPKMSVGGMATKKYVNPVTVVDNRKKK